MATLKQFTCITYDNVDFLIPCEYIVAGLYMPVEENTKDIVYNRETLPLLQIGSLLEKEFFCSTVTDVETVLVMNKRDFVSDVSDQIAEYSETAYPASGNMAFSLVGEIKSVFFSSDELEPIPEGIRDRMISCGICAIRFTEEGRKQLLISPDLVIRKFFAGALM